MDSRSTLSQIHAIIHHALDYAVYPAEIISSNPAISKRGYFFSTLKTQSSNRYIVIDNFLAGELRCWKKKQHENEISAGDSYVYAYRDADNKLIQQICTRENGQAILKSNLAKFFAGEEINAHSFRHTHIRTTRANCRTIQQKFFQKLCRQIHNADKTQTNFQNIVNLSN